MPSATATSRIERHPQRLDLLPTVAVRRQPGGFQNPFDMEPAERLLLLDAIQVAD
jgi:hypothetical protein